MSIVKGIDVGYAYTKDNDKRIFKSAYSYTDLSVLGSTRLTINGIDYYPNCGNSTSEFDKTDSEINLVCTMYNLFLTQRNENQFLHDYKLVVGLPVSQFKLQRDKLRNSVLDYNKKEVYVNGHKLNFSISDVYVVMQSVASLYTLNNPIGDYLLLDIGGLTFDVSHVRVSSTNTQLIQFDTWYKGIRTLYSKVMEWVNNEFKIQLDDSYADNILQTGKLFVDNEYKDCSFIKPMLKEYIDSIVQSINIKYPVRNCNIILVGGGALLMANSFKRYYPNLQLVKNSQFSNVQGYKIIGDYKFVK